MTPDPIPDPAAPNRDGQMHFRVSAAEKRAIATNARAAGYRKTSDYLRTLGLRGEVREVLPPELRRQLVGIGINLNQLTRRAQAGASYATDEAALRQALAIIRGYLS